MNVMINIIANDKNNNKILLSFYLLEFYNVWHSRLDDVNYNSMQMLTNHELLPSMIFEKNRKCEICVKSKFTKPYFQTIKKQ